MDGFVDWILAVPVVILVVIICWAIIKSGEIQRIRDQWHALRPVTRHRSRKLFVAAAVVAIVFGAAVVGAFSTGHATLGLALLVGLVVFNGIVAPALRVRAMKRNLASSASETKKPR